MRFKDRVDYRSCHKVEKPINKEILISENLKELLIIIPFLSFTLLFSGVCYWDGYFSYFGISLFNVDLNKVELLIEGAQSEALYFIIICFLFFAFIVLMRILEVNLVKQILKNKWLKTLVNNSTQFDSLLFMSFIFLSLLLFWTLLGPFSFKHGIDSAKKLQDRRSYVVVQYKTPNDRKRESLVRVKGNSIFKDSSGVWFFALEINDVLLKQPVAMYIPNSQINSMYIGSVDVVYTHTGSVQFDVITQEVFERFESLKGKFLEKFSSIEF